MGRKVDVTKDSRTSVYVLNTIREEDKQKARDELGKGKFVHLGCSAIGHTRSNMVERQWAEWMDEEFGGRYETVYPEEFPLVHYHLIEDAPANEPGGKEP